MISRRYMAAVALGTAVWGSVFANADIRLHIGAFTDGETASALRGDGIAVAVENASEEPLPGPLFIAVSRWDSERPELVGEIVPSGAVIAPGVKKTSTVNTASLEPDGYVVRVKAGTKTLAERKLGVFARYNPKSLFGIGNGMVCEYRPGNKYYGERNSVEARDLNPVCLGKGDAYEIAIVRAPNSTECGIDGPCQNGEEGVNTPDGKHINAHSPAGRAELVRRAREFGLKAARNQQWAATKLENEQFYLNRGDICPDAWADADFRAWLRRRYRDDLAKLNVAWGTACASWDDVRQPISAVDGAGQEARTGGEAIDWTAAMGKMTDEAKAAIRANPAQSLDWFRWRAVAVNKCYARYIAEAKKCDGGRILYGNNYPWPNYFPHSVWPQWKSQDVIMLDVQYVCGIEKTLGNNEEMIDILEAAESIGGDRPIWGREVYYQPRYPGEIAALQNWAMIAHGMDVALVFAWKPFADYNREIFETGPRSWERPEAQPMWFMIDTDGTRLPGYHAAKRSAAELAAFDKVFDARSLERIPGETALFWAADTSAYIMYQTFDRPYFSPHAQARPAITAGLRYRGARVEFLDDSMTDRLLPERFKTVVVPPAPVVSEKALAALRQYAAAGGHLVVFAPFNTLDVNLRAKEAAGTAEWKGRITTITDFPGRYSPPPHEPLAYARWFDAFVENSGIVRSAWWENEFGHIEGEENLLPGEGSPIVEVVVRRHAKTGAKFAFVLNKGGAGKGVLRGPDFAGGKLVDALTGKPEPLAFELPAFGYRVFELKQSR